MSLKRKSRVTESFSMASMTDVIFLLLIFFLVTSTIVVPNAIKITLPSANAEAQKQTPPLRLTITPDLHYYLSEGNDAPAELSIEEMAQHVGVYAAKHPEAFVAIYADESVPYREVVRLVSIVSSANLKTVLATRPIPSDNL